MYDMSDGNERATCRRDAETKHDVAFLNFTLHINLPNSPRVLQPPYLTAPKASYGQAAPPAIVIGAVGAGQPC